MPIEWKQQRSLINTGEKDNEYNRHNNNNPTNYYFLYMFNIGKVIIEEEKEILELEEDIKMDKFSVFVPKTVYTPQYTCPNCGELFDGHECENCKYTEERWESNLYLKVCYYG